MPRLVSAAAQVVAPGGWLVLASNQGRVSPHQWRGQVAEGLAKARRPAVELAFFGAAPDFPAAVTFPEGHYLKVGVWAVG
jgi:23S rRNA (cytosine1962-C5)-methyltransferase